MRHVTTEKRAKGILCHKTVLIDDKKTIFHKNFHKSKISAGKCRRRKDNRLILLYKGLKVKARIPTDDLIPKTRRGRNKHSLAFQIPSASKDLYKYSFFPQTIRDWNDLPESLISSELSDDSVSKFTSLVRARD